MFGILDPRPITHHLNDHERHAYLRRVWRLKTTNWTNYITPAREGRGVMCLERNDMEIDMPSNTWKQKPPTHNCKWSAIFLWTSAQKKMTWSRHQSLRRVRCNLALHVEREYQQGNCKDFLSSKGRMQNPGFILVYGGHSWLWGLVPTMLYNIRSINVGHPICKIVLTVWSMRKQTNKKQKPKTIEIFHGSNLSRN